MIKSLLDRKTQVEEALLLCHRSDLMFFEWERKCLSGALQLLGPGKTSMNVFQNTE
ncbi:hypothetical protein DAPPUDRAFT_321492 [Daphnia pulex]|uniref:Uncharacterized protein n=1 Tax=Daphnia pulex TaxID=6669 RepID=E9GTC6_DAPPU|nr:hypothetical protein DAPPUDRAFT_321492 [Daphnia pulex]|eukprot:EFX77384.1 hypothetical protein DAPPUDRAFT_321492 [Daphnia pulex]